MLVKLTPGNLFHHTSEIKEHHHIFKQDSTLQKQAVAYKSFAQNLMKKKF